ncbi:MAG TPA: DUF4846 domain-containing protein [Clostridiales bacterium]|nr:DUF4846 domain-containing protein [Clostridiales bacterium]
MLALCLLLLSVLFTACEAKPEDTSRQPEASVTEEPPSVTPEPTSAVPGNSQEAGPAVTEAAKIVSEPLIKADGRTVAERFGVPKGFTRLEPEEESFAYYLQNLPLKPEGTKVRYYDGRKKTRDVYLAVVDFSLGERDLQQCADGVIRLRAEYLYSKGRYDEIHFNFVSGFNAEFSKWADGRGISVNGNKVSWNSNRRNDGSYESFQRYLDIVYAYASTLSLEKELVEKPFSELAIGDVLIQGGSPGHCVIVVDLAVNEATGEKIFMLAQSYMPAQDIQILKGDSEGSPWVLAGEEGTLKTPEWTFQTSDLKTWK